MRWQTLRGRAPRAVTADHRAQARNAVDSMDPNEELQRLRSELAQAQERIVALNAAQEEFLRAVSHDLRAPLRHVTSYGALVRESLQELPPTPAAEEALGFLATMDQSARRMARMIDALHALNRASRAALRPEPQPLCAALEQARAAVGGADTAVDCRFDPRLPTLRADAALLHDLLVQLLGNAIKFSQRSNPPRITVQPDAAPPGRVAFTVVDNGAGFDPARAGQLFGLFQRLHRETEFDGVGGGLALSRLIVERHGGAISATAAPGVGCVVRVEWPLD